MDPQVNTVSPQPPPSSDSNMALDTKEDSLGNGHKTAPDAKEGDAKIRFWSDSILAKTFFETNYLKKPSSYEEHLIMRMYLRWYMGFEMGSINPAELVCQMALLTPSSVKDTSIFEDLFGVTTFDGITYPSKTRRTLIPVRNVRLPELTPGMLNSYYKSSECNTKEQLTELGEKEKSEICSFYSYAKSTLSITENNNLNKMVLKCYLGLSALVTLRLISKQTLTVQKTFVRLRFGRMFFQLFDGTNYDHPMCPPHLKSLDDVKKGLDLRLPNIKITLHAIILQYIIYRRRSKSNSINKACWMLYSLLLFIELYGLPLVRLYLNLSLYLPEELLVEASSELLSNLFKHYYGETPISIDICKNYISHQDSWKWCRLLDESYFSEFSIESNAQLAYNMAELVTTLSTQKANMWNMVGFKNNLNVDMKKEAEIFCKSIKLKMQEETERFVLSFKLKFPFLNEKLNEL